MKGKVIYCFFFFALNLIFIQVAKSQCNVNVKKTSEANRYEAAEENLFIYRGIGDNGQISEGWYVIKGSLAYYVAPNGNSLWRLLIASKAMYFKPLVPRTVTFTFSNNSKLTIVADNYKQIDGYEVCYYTVAETDISKFSYSINRLEINDTRQNKTIGKSLEYSNVLSEQYDCIKKELLF